MSSELEGAIAKAKAKLEAEYRQKEIDLNDRFRHKRDLQGELDKLVDAAKAKLEADFSARYSKLEEEYQTKIAELNRKSLALDESNKKNIEEQKSKLIEQAAEINRTKQFIASRQVELDSLDFKLKEIQHKQDLDAKSLEECRVNIASKQTDLDKQKTLLEKDSISNEKSRQDLAVAWEDCKKARESFHAEMKDLSDQRAELKIVQDKIDAEKKALSDWRDQLDERDISLKEKEKYLILKGREVDEKLRTLQELRKAGSI